MIDKRSIGWPAYPPLLVRVRGSDSGQTVSSVFGKKRPACGTCSRKQTKPPENGGCLTNTSFRPWKMKAQALTILILSTLAFAASSLGIDAGSHFDRYAVSSDAPEHVSGDRFFDSSHERGNVNLRSTPRRALQIPEKETQRTVAIPSVRISRITKSVLLMKLCVLTTNFRLIRCLLRRCRRRQMKLIGWWANVVMWTGTSKLTSRRIILGE